MSSEARQAFERSMKMTEVKPILAPSRAGMVCFNHVGMVLVVSALGKTDEWVLPKGHIEKNELSFEAAEREVREEASVRAQVFSQTKPLGITECWQPVKVVMPDGTEPKEHVVIEWWTGRAFAPLVVDPAVDYVEADFRMVKWLPWKTALEVLSFEDQRNMVRRALCMAENDHGRNVYTPERELANY